MAVDAFLVLLDKKGEKALEGECTDAVFKGSIELSKFNFDAVSGVESQVRDSNALQYKAEVRKLAGQEAIDSFTFSIEKQIDKASPDLFLSYCEFMAKRDSGPSFKSATVYLCIGGIERTGSKDDVTWVKLEFSKLTVSQYGLRLDTELNIPDENITMLFESYKLTYRPQKETGELDRPRTLGYDFHSQNAL